MFTTIVTLDPQPSAAQIVIPFLSSNSFIKYVDTPVSSYSGSTDSPLLNRSYTSFNIFN